MSSSTLPDTVSDSAAQARQLRGGSLTALETIGQSIANIAPTCTPALNISVVAGLAGVGSWLAYLIATIGMMFVAANVGTLAKRHPLAGSYFVYIGRTLGPLAGMIAGWSMIAAYLLTGVAVVISSQIFLANMLSALGLAKLMVPGWLFYVVFVGGIWACAYRDIRLSSRVAVILEAISISVIVLITALVLVQGGHVVDPSQTNLAHLPFGGVAAALAFAVFSFVGFESAATLAKEARDPTRTIPFAVTASAGVVGLLFTVLAYCMVLAVGGDAKVIGDSSSPFAEITTRAGLGWAAAIVYLAALISVFACGLACLNASSRLMFSMGRYQFLHGAMGLVHARHQTPHHAVTASALIVLAISLATTGLVPIDAFGYTGTFATFGFLVVYLLICAVAPLDVQRAGAMRPRHAVVGALGVVIMLLVIFGSLYPVPPYPYNLLPYLFIGYLLLGAAWFALRRRQAPEALAGVHHDLEM